VKTVYKQKTSKAYGIVHTTLRMTLSEAKTGLGEALKT